MLQLQDRTIDLETGDISTGERLSQLECRLLRHLMKLDGGIARRDALLVEVWGYTKPIQSRAVDTAVRRVRNKIELEPRKPRHLLTVQGDGYRLCGLHPHGMPLATDDARLERLSSAAAAGAPVTEEDVDTALGWTGPKPVDRARLVLAVERRFWRAGRRETLGRWFDAVLADDLPGETASALLVLRAELLRQRGLTEHARNDASRALELASEPALRGRALHVLGLVAHTTSAWEDAERFYREAEALLAGPRPIEACQCAADRAIVLFTLQDSRALGAARRAVTEARRVQFALPDEPLARQVADRAARGLCSVLVGLGRGDEAAPRLEDLVGRNRDERPGAAASACSLLGTLELDRNDSEQAMAWFGLGLDLATRAGEVPVAALMHNGLGCAHAMAGRDVEALASLRQCLWTFETSDMPSRTVVPRCWLAVVLHRRGEHGAAWQQLELAKAALSASEGPGVRAVLASAQEALGGESQGVAGSSLPYVRIARRAWGLTGAPSAVHRTA